ncbi:MAG: hypothetical protein LUD72_06280 [Bacteroidales bacterium]|nr:hypothetical protein [Bacteroidales bacterium]
MKKNNLKAVAFIAPGIQSMWPVGSYNGYVAVSPSHPLYKVAYLDGNEALDNIDVHGGITWSNYAQKEYLGKDGKMHKAMTNMVEKGDAVSGNMEDIKEDWWVFGFDTAHVGDNSYNWNKETVTKETLRFLEQIEKVSQN